MAFNDLEKWKHKNFLEKQYTGAHATIEQKPYGATLDTTPAIAVYKLINVWWSFIFL